MSTPASPRTAPAARSRRILAAGLLGAGLACLASCSRVSMADPEVWQGQHHGAEEAVCARLTDAEAWRKAWQQVGREPPRAWPGGDAVALLMLDRQRPSGGYRPVLEGRADGMATIRVEAPADPATAVMTRPWLMALYPGRGPRALACSQEAERRQDD